MRPILRMALPCLAAFVFLGWWENSTSPHYVGPPAWGLVMAGLFWLTAGGAVYAAVAEVRRVADRRRVARQH